MYIDEMNISDAFREEKNACIKEFFNFKNFEIIEKKRLDK